MQVNITLDETLMDGVHQRLDQMQEQINAIQGLIEAFVTYEVATDEEEALNMGVVSEKVESVLAEAQEQSTVIDGLVVWAQGQKDVLEQVRADLAAAIENGATAEDLAGLDEAIAAFDTNTGRVTQVVTSGTDAEGEEPVNPVPDQGPMVPPQPTTPGNATDPSTAPDV